MKKSIGIVLIIVMILSCIMGCNNNANLVPVDSIDTSDMGESTVYNENEIKNVAIVDEAVYYVHSLEEADEVQILRLGTDETVVIYQDTIYSYHVMAYGHWVYYHDWDNSDSKTSTLWRIDLTDGQVEKVLDEVLECVICPSGIFWTDNRARAIQHADLDGSNISTIYATGEKDYPFISGLHVYHHSLYFTTYDGQSIRYHTDYYKVDLVTGVVEKPEELKIFKSEDGTTRTSEFVHEIAGIDPVIFSLYEGPVQLFAADNGWMYYKTAFIWYDPVTGLFEIEKMPNRFYKIREDGTEKTYLNNLTVEATCFAARDGWIYYSERTDEGNLVYRVREDGSETQTIISDSCEVRDVIDGDIYYTKEFDGNGEPMQDNLYRIPLDGTGEPERLY